MLKIELDASDCALQSDTYPAKDGKLARTVYYQIGYMYTGGRYPVKVKLPMESGQPAYPAGQYFMHPSSFQATKFNKPEINPFKTILAPLNEIDLLLDRDFKNLK